MGMTAIEPRCFQRVEHPVRESDERVPRKGVTKVCSTAERPKTVIFTTCSLFEGIEPSSVRTYDPRLVNRLADRREAPNRTCGSLRPSEESPSMRSANFSGDETSPGDNPSRVCCIEMEGGEFASVNESPSKSPLGFS
ncbi:hypothetical protein TNCV_2003771 [Trichonephila clavipes]|nr:hypothetical protein TNCV_2003771 [Trichonephila clavipes]